MIIIMIIITIMMMIMPIVTGVRKDFRENVSRPNQISLLLPPAKRHLRLNLDTK